MLSLVICQSLMMTVVQALHKQSRVAVKIQKQGKEAIASFPQYVKLERMAIASCQSSITTHNSRLTYHFRYTLSLISFF